MQLSVGCAPYGSGSPWVNSIWQRSCLAIGIQGKKHLGTSRFATSLLVVSATSKVELSDAPASCTPCISLMIGV